MLCPEHRIPAQLLGDMGGTLLIVTERGSHCAYSEGHGGGGHYLARVSMEFLAAARGHGTHAVDVT